MKLLYIIGYRHSLDRYENLKKTINWLSNIKSDEITIEVVVVEQDTTPKMPEISGIFHIFVYNPWPFNRSWSFNIAAKEFDSDVYAFGDSDLIMDTSEFISSIKESNNFDILSPYKSVLDLTEVETFENIDFWKKIDRSGRGETDHQKINLCGGLVIFTKKGFDMVGGWNEDFIGWGGEDDFMTLKVETLGLTTKEMPYRIYHLYHKRESPDINFYQRNLMILNRSIGLKKESLEEYIELVLPTIGSKNKYSMK